MYEESPTTQQHNRDSRILLIVTESPFSTALHGILFENARDTEFASSRAVNDISARN